MGLNGCGCRAVSRNSATKYTYCSHKSTETLFTVIGRLSTSLPLNTINFVFLALIFIPRELKNFVFNVSFLTIPSLVVGKITVSPIRTRCNHCRKPSIPQLFFFLYQTNDITDILYKTKSRHEVGEPWRTPTHADIRAVPNILFVTVYSLFNIANKTFIFTLLYAMAKSTKNNK